MLNLKPNTRYNQGMNTNINSHRSRAAFSPINVLPTLPSPAGKSNRLFSPTLKTELSANILTLNPKGRRVPRRSINTVTQTFVWKRKIINPAESQKSVDASSGKGTNIYVAFKSEEGGFLQVKCEISVSIIAPPPALRPQLGLINNNKSNLP